MDTLTKIPHVQAAAIKKETLQQLICNRIGWPIEQYNHFQFEAGVQFVEDQLRSLQELDIKVITRSAMFWGWWRNQWMTRDESLYTTLLLDAEQYTAIHTYLLQWQDAVILSFWNHIETMIADGSKRISESEEGI